MITIESIGLIISGDTSVKPTVRHAHGLLGIVILARIGCTFIKCHHNVCADLTLGVDDILGCENMLGAVYVTAKLRSFFFDLADVGERIHLIAATVYQYGPIPSDESMKATGSLYHAESRSQIEVIGVSQNDLCIDLGLELGEVDGLDSTGCADRHEYLSLIHI